MDIFNIKAISPNAKTTHTTFTASGRPTKVKNIVLAANPVLVLKAYPALKSHTNATKEQMKLIASKSKDELLKMKADFDAEKAKAFREQEKTKTAEPQKTENKAKKQ